MNTQSVSSNTGNAAQPLWTVPNRGAFVSGDALTTQQKEMVESQQQAAISPEENRKMKKACQDFESFFLSYLMKQMRATVPQGGFLQESRPQQIYRDMLDDSVADSVTRSNKGIGLADMLYKTLQQQQGQRVYTRQQNAAHAQSPDGTPPQGVSSAGLQRTSLEK